MARKYHSAQSSGYTILVIDDSREMLQSTQRLLEAEGHRVLTAVDGPAGLALLDEERVHVILCDYFMPGMTGEEVVRRVRESDTLVQIILVTGYSGEKPARVMMRELDIQGYHDKGEGGERLLLWVDTALKAYRHVVAMEKHRKGLRFILDLTPELHRIQPMGDLLQGLLWQVEGLIGAENSFLATLATSPRAHLSDPEDSDTVVALSDPEDGHTGMQIRVGTGRYQPGVSTDALPEPDRTVIHEALHAGAVWIQGGASAVPLRLGNRALGVIYLDRRSGYERDRELLEIFATQAAAAIQNSILYDIATTDALTGVYVRNFAVQQLYRSIRHAIRRTSPLSLLMVDLDRFKEVNDTYGHQVGDQALRRVGDLLRGAVRETDVVGRYGGDEFMIILPDTPAGGAVIAANRLLKRAASLDVEVEGRSVPLRLSVGIGTLQVEEGEPERMADYDAIRGLAEDLVAYADRALYSAKGTGRPGEDSSLHWARREALVG